MNRDRLRSQLRVDEGTVLKVYKCPAGYLTIGTGRNLEGKGITQAEADYLLDNDINECWGQLNSAYPWFSALDDVRQEVLVNMCFNLGFAGLSKFKNTLGLIEKGDYANASYAMKASIWAGQVGKRAERLAYAMKEGKFE